MRAVAACTLSRPIFPTFTQFITRVVFQCLQRVARFVFHCASSENENNNQREFLLAILGNFLNIPSNGDEL